MEVHCFHCQCSCSGILPVTHKSLTSHTKLCRCEPLQLGFIHISICCKCSQQKWLGQNICVTTAEV